MILDVMLIVPSIIFFSNSVMKFEALKFNDNQESSECPQSRENQQGASPPNPVFPYGEPHDHHDNMVPRGLRGEQHNHSLPQPNLAKDLPHQRSDSPKVSLRQEIGAVFSQREPVNSISFKQPINVTYSRCQQPMNGQPIIDAHSRPMNSQPIIDGHSRPMSSQPIIDAYSRPMNEVGRSLANEQALQQPVGTVHYQQEAINNGAYLQPITNANCRRRPINGAPCQRPMSDIRCQQREPMNDAHCQRGPINEVRCPRGPMSDVRFQRGPMSAAQCQREPMSDVRCQREPMIDVQCQRGPMSDVHCPRGPMKETYTQHQIHGCDHIDKGKSYNRQHDIEYPN